MLLSPDRIVSRGLHILQQEPQQLVTPLLHKQAINPQEVHAIPFQAKTGSMIADTEYQYPLAIIIAEQNYYEKPVLDQEDDSNFWGMRMNTHRKMAVKQDRLSQHDQALVSLLASEYGRDGVFVDIVILASHLRKRGIGSEFLDNLGQVFKKMGFLYTVGIITDATNLPYFLKTRYLVDELNPKEIQKRGFYLNNHSYGIPTVSFLDKTTEQECVIPEFLKR